MHRRRASGSCADAASLRRGHEAVDGPDFPFAWSIPPVTQGGKDHEEGNTLQQGRTGGRGSLQARKSLRNLMVPEAFLGWQMRDSNPRRRCQLIYSQPPLAARVICRTSKEDHPRLQCSERPFPGRSASSNRGQDNFTELLPKNRIEPLVLGNAREKPRNRAENRPESGLAENASGEPGLELHGLLLGDLVQFDRT